MLFSGNTFMTKKHKLWWQYLSRFLQSSKLSFQLVYSVLQRRELFFVVTGRPEVFTIWITIQVVELQRISFKSPFTHQVILPIYKVKPLVQCTVKKRGLCTYITPKFDLMYAYTCWTKCTLRFNLWLWVDCVQTNTFWLREWIFRSRITPNPKIKICKCIKNG